MAFSFFALLDDVASLLDDVASMSKDVAAMTKIAGKKTAGILGDDLAVNAEKATGFASKRELPIIFKIAKGSFINKIILLPILFLLSYYLPQAVIPILLLGGAYLTYEGVEKVIHTFINKGKNNHKAIKELNKDESVKFENEKIKSAIMVDFILSLEIIIITLSVVIDEPIKNQIVIVSIVSILATIGVYGVVALIVRLDDMGLYLIANGKLKITKKIGQFLVKLLPIIIKILIVVGTIAMLLVGGGIFLHNIHFLESIDVPLPFIVKELIVGLIVGILVFGIVGLFKIIYKKFSNG